jgi:hypothetical protein
MVSPRPVQFAVKNQMQGIFKLKALFFQKISYGGKFFNYPRRNPILALREL